MKTPLQQLIDDWEDFSNKEANHLFTAIASTFINGAKEMLEQEKRIIDDAYLCGLNRGVAFQQSQEMGVLCEWPSDRDYYEETFNIKEE